MEYKIVEKDTPGRGKLRVLGETFEKGKPEGESAGRWLHKLRDRQEMLKYLEASKK